VACCELPRLPGQQHGKIRLGTMLHELSVLFHIGLFFQWQKLSKKAKFEKLGNEVIFGHWNGQKFILKRERKVSRLPYLVLVSTKPAICKED
jgi:hypothetical protein